MTSNHNHNHNHNNLSKISQPFNGVRFRSRSRSRSPDPSPHKRNRSRRHTLPSKFHYHPNFSHPYFSQHSHHLCDSLNDDSIDTSSLNQGILFYQDPSNGETNFYWEDELETCSPSLMPENTDNLTLDDISGDSTELEEKYFRIMAKKLSNRKEEENLIDLGESPVKVVNLTEDLMNVDDTDIALPPEDFIVPPENNEFDLEDMVKEMNELLSDKNQELEKEEKEEEVEEEEEEEEEEGGEEEDEEEEEEEPPSPLSPRDPEREGPVLSEEEENTEEGVLYRIEHDPKFQDEAGLDDNEESQISDDEGMDPMENH